MALVLDQFSQIPFATATTQFFIILSLLGLLLCSSYIAPGDHETKNDGVPRKIFMSVYIISAVLTLNLLGGDSHAGLNITSAEFWIAFFVLNLDLIKQLTEKQENVKQRS
ncbi:hypothetical protein [Salinicoccus sp. HZC-1]|uniref:hypothetical protein n=1 Tax=Salinicoccus sp. HZC-1 TaxID=3385497 RepID=UPI00398A840C